jgi:hypothetical protein
MKHREELLRIQWRLLLNNEALTALMPLALIMRKADLAVEICRRQACFDSTHSVANSAATGIICNMEIT